MRYLPSPPALGDSDPTGGLETLEKHLTAMLASRLPAETSAGRPLVGPQRDDVEIRLAGRGAGHFASAGEQRRACFVLCMAALRLASGLVSGAGTILLDDVEAEFDDRRLEQVFAFLRESGIQAFVATSKGDVARRFAEHGTAHVVRSGQVVPLGQGARS